MSSNDAAANLAPVWIACPANSVTGGPEALHQLCDSLRRQGVNAWMLYFDMQKGTESGRSRMAAMARSGNAQAAAAFGREVTHVGEARRPSAYGEYDAPSMEGEIIESGVVIAPENHPSALRLVPGARRLVWWLSVDNAWTNGALMRDMDFQISGHLFQSQYARRFVELCGFGRSESLSDYVNLGFLEDFDATGQRRTVAYNPKKGVAFTRRIVEANPGLSFVPIENLDRSGVHRLLGQSVAYIDFGSHPGRDRLPREAVLCGTPILVADMGAAASYEDMPISDEFKFVRRLDNIPQISSMLRACLRDPRSVAEAQSALRVLVKSERPTFDREVAELIERWL